MGRLTSAADPESEFTHPHSSPIIIHTYIQDSPLSLLVDPPNPFGSYGYTTCSGLKALKISMVRPDRVGTLQ